MRASSPPRGAPQGQTRCDVAGRVAYCRRHGREGLRLLCALAGVVEAAVAADLKRMCGEQPPDRFWFDARRDRTLRVCASAPAGARAIGFIANIDTELFGIVFVFCAVVFGIRGHPHGHGKVGLQTTGSEVSQHTLVLRANVDRVLYAVNSRRRICTQIDKQ